ncbi:non-specific serine,threonine protein kinase [Sarracenia purpurea var. burkii]
MHIAKLKGELSVENSKHRLVCGNDQVVASSESRMLLHWGSVNLQNLLSALQDIGINPCVERGMSDTESEYIVRVLEPKRALIEINAAGTVISTADEKLASLIYEVICKSLDGI